jgi:anti-anti-sigma factor
MVRVPELADLVVARGDDGVVIAQLRGELDMETVDAIRARLAEAITSEATRLVVDLTNVTFMDSSGVELLYRLRAQLAIRQMQLSLVLAPDALIRRTLEVSDGGAELLALTTPRHLTSSRGPP